MESFKDKQTSALPVPHVNAVSGGQKMKENYRDILVQWSPGFLSGCIHPVAAAAIAATENTFTWVRVANNKICFSATWLTFWKGRHYGKYGYHAALEEPVLVHSGSIFSL